MIPFRLYLFILVGIAVLGLSYFLLRRKPKPADDLAGARPHGPDPTGRLPTGSCASVTEETATTAC